MTDTTNNKPLTSPTTTDSNSNNVNSAPSSFPPINQQTQTSQSASFSQDSGNFSSRSGNNKLIATILSVVVLVGAVAAGVFLVGQNEEVRIKAWDCTNYIFEVSDKGDVTARNGSTTNEPEQQATVKINGTVVATLDVPSLNAGEATTLGSVPVPGEGFIWEVSGTKQCSDDGKYGIPTGNTSDVSPTEQPKDTITPAQLYISAECSGVLAYDTNWNLLSQTDLESLNEGDTIYLAVSGTTSNGTFDMARFTINGVLQPETTLQNASLNVFYQEYTIPANTNYTITGEIHHSSLDWI